jgi:Cu+-exporting ATPase
MTEYNLSIGGMTCAGCVAAVEKAVNKNKHVDKVAVSFAEHSAVVTTSLTLDELIAIINKAGYQAAQYKDIAEETRNHDLKEKQKYKQRIKQSIAAGLIGFPLMISGWMGQMPAVTSQIFWLAVALLTLMVMVYSGGHYYKSSFKAFKAHNATMDTLVALGTGAAWLYSFAITLQPELVPEQARHAYFEAAAILLSLLNLGSALETRAKRQTSKAIQELIGLQPDTATVIRDGKELQVAIEQIGLSETLRAKPGECFAVDGEIIDGTTTVDESMITGEPLAVKKKKGDKVTAGTINQNGSVLYIAKHIGADTVLSRIIGLVRKGQNAKPQIGRLADKVTAIFVPSVLIIAVLAALVWYNFGPEPVATYMLVTSMTVLVIACPCALGLATPISIMVAVGNSAKKGILVRNGEALQSASQLSTIVLDKTGTITQGKPQVVNIYSFNAQWDEQTVLQYGASLEAASEHPLAQAVIKSAIGRGVTPITIQNFEAIPGFGIQGAIEDKTVFVGNQKWLENNKIDLQNSAIYADEWTALGQTVIYLVVAKQLIAIISISDPIKHDAKQAIDAFHQQGLEVVMLTGDQEKTARAIAKQIGIDQVVADVLPEDKANQIATLQAQGKRVAMVGDGINDAPALALADVGFAIGTGTDIAIESADITLMNGSLNGVVEAIAISKATIRNIKQNLFGAFVYNIIGIPIAAGILFPVAGILLNPMFAGAAMALSSVTVVTNANRLKNFNMSKK